MSSRSNAPTDLDKHVSNRVRAIRMQRGLSLKQVADKIGLMYQQFHKYEAGLLRISAGLLVSLAEALECEVADFFPPELRGDKTLDVDLRLDLLKQEIITLVQDIDSEQALLALRTLLQKESNREAEAVNGTTG